MQKPKKSKGRSPKKSVDWVHYIDKDAPRLVVPVGPRFQATVPELTEQHVGGSLDDSRWLGTRTWPTGEERSSNTNAIGKGRPESCNCAHPGSVNCVNCHVTEERKILVCELGPAFKDWKFDTMGEEDVLKSWTNEQQKKFDTLVRMNPVSKDKTFLKPALKSFPSKTKEELVNYYLNVYLPRRIGQLIRSGVLEIDTDDETEIKAVDSLKRSRPEKGDSSKNVKPRYLVGKR